MSKSYRRLKSRRTTEFYEPPEAEAFFEVQPMETAKSASFRTLLQYITPREFFFLIFGLIITFFYALVPIVLVFSVGQLIDNMTGIESMDDFYDDSRKLSIIQYILGLTSMVLSWISVASLIYIGNRQGTIWKHKYFKAIINRPIKWFDRHNPTELGSAIDLECDAIEHAIGEQLVLLISSLIFFIASWIVAFTVCAVLALIALCALPAELFCGYLIQHAVVEGAEEYQEKYKTAGGIAEETLEGVKTVASCNAQQSRAHFYQSQLAGLQAITVKTGLTQGLGWSGFFAGAIASAGVLFYVSAIIMVDEPSIFGTDPNPQARDVMIIFFATALSSMMLGSALPCIQAIENGKVAAARVDRIIKRSKKYDGNFIPKEIEGLIEFENVEFSYPTNPNMQILKGVTVKIEPEDSLAVVGETGSGKSTIVQLIEGFYYPDSGSVKIDGMDIRNYNLKGLREFIGLVSQEPILFNCSIKENIRMGKLDATNEDIENAAEEAEARDFIEALPQKYETWTGLKGSQLSGGQKQRLAIARAVIKRPKILLLDEATSALDTTTEKNIQETLNKVLKGKTTVTVAQRLSTIKSAHHILVLDKGKVAEYGTYDELLEKKGIFARLLEVRQKAEEQTAASESRTEPRAAAKETAKIEQVMPQHSQGEIMKRLLILTKEYWKFLLFALIFAIMSGLVFPFFGYFFADDLFEVLNPVEDSKDNTRDDMFVLISLAVVILVSLTLVCGLLAKVAAEYTYRLRYESLSSLLYYDQRFFDQPESAPSSLAYNLGVDCANVSNIGGPILALLLMITASVVTGIIIALYYNPFLAGVLVLCLPLLVYTMTKGSALQMKGLSKNDLKKTSSIASDGLTNIKTVHAFNRQEYFESNYVKATAEENTNVVKASHINGVIFGSRQFALFFMYATGCWVGAYLVKEDHMHLDEFLYSYFSIVFAVWGFIAVGAVAPDIEGGVKSAKKIFGIIDYQPIIDAKQETGSKEEILGAFEFRDVCFMYSTRNIMVLDHVNFRIEPGTTLGVTGTTGSGKSTIAQLLLRFYDPTEGTVYLDGLPLQNYNIKHLRNAVCWVSQEPILFQGSIMYNLQVAKPDVTMEEAIKALTQAQAMDIIKKYGVESDVGLRGSKLSGGQKQRVAIARALVRTPNVLVLDESTSALDNITERNFQDAIKDEKFTIIAIAHRLTTIKDYDQIIILEAGNIVEKGNHESLMAINGGVYRRLYETSE